MILKNFRRSTRHELKFRLKTFKPMFGKIIICGRKISRKLHIFLFCKFLSYYTINNRLFGDQNDQRKRLYSMILFECESEDTHVTAGGTPWNYPSSIGLMVALSATWNGLTESYFFQESRMVKWNHIS